jgi:PKD repeat protein
MSWSFQASALKGIKTIKTLVAFLADQLFALFQAARYYEPIANLTYGTTVQPNGSRSGIQRIEVTDSTAFTVLNPTLPKEGVSLTLDFINSADGTIGAVTFGSEYKLDGAFTKPTIDNHCVYTFYRAKDNVWRETSRSKVASTNPTAGFTVSKSALVVAFTDISTAVSPATITSWSWTFGDSATSASQNPSHTYGAAGTYTVVLSVIDSNGSTDDFTLQVVVAANVAPVASFQVSKTLLHCQFTDTSTDSDGSVTAWDWDFGDLSVHNTSQNPAHNYVSAGTYTVVLVVTDNLGATSTVSHNVTVVSAGTNPPNASFRVTKTNLTVRVTDTSTDDGTITAWNYNWGDGTTHATTQNPNHTYASAGTYTITQTVTDNDSLTDTATQSVTVSASSSTGIPFGPFDLLANNTSLRPNHSSFNLTLDNVSSDQIIARIDFAHSVGIGLVLAMTGGPEPTT